MPETPIESAAAPERARLWRPVFLWTAAILALAGVAWFVGAVVVPVWRVRRALQHNIDRMRGLYFDPADERTFISARLGPPEAISAHLERYLDTPEILAPYRETAAYWLRYAGPGALPALTRALRHSDPAVRGAAVLGLASLTADTRDPSPMPLFIEALSDPDMDVRKKVVCCQAHVVTVMPDIVPELERLLDHPGPATRTTAAVALWAATNDGRKPMTLLLAALKDSDPSVRREAARALCLVCFRAGAAIPALVKLTKDTNSEVRGAAEYALQECRGVPLLNDDYGNALDPIFANLADNNWAVRAGAAVELGSVRGPDLQDAVAALRRALKDENECVRDCAAYALKQFTPDELAPPEPLVIAMGFDKEKAVVEYRIGSRPAFAPEPVFIGEDALLQQVEKKVARRGEVSVRLELHTGFEPIFQREFDAAKAACEAAGAKVVGVPKDPAPLMTAYERADGREAKLALRIVGVRDGELQFRLGDQLIDGQAALIEALRARIPVIEKEKGGFTRVEIELTATPEIDPGNAQYEALWKPILDIGPGLWASGYRDSGGRKYRMVSGPDGKMIPVNELITVSILAPCKTGNVYGLDGQRVEGEAALTAALRKRLAEFRAGKEGPGRFKLSVTLRVEVRPGVTATEEQLELARKTIAASGVEKPETQ